MKDEDNIPTMISVKPLKSEYSHLQKIPLTSEQFTLGRSMENSAVIPYLSISRLHCIFNKLENNDWYIKDCSSFGISINNKKLDKGSELNLSHGDIITLEPTAEFVYRFSDPNSNDFEIPKKRIKIEKHTDNGILNNVKIKFEESQNYEIKHIEEKIQNAKQLQTTSIILKQRLQSDMERRIQLLESDFAQQIENVKGEKNEVERQKALLMEERDGQLAQVKNEMEGRISELMEQIQKHNENESELVKENNLLKDKLDKEREEFLAELTRESSSKKDMLEKLEAKIREQEEVRLREKQELEQTLKRETEQLRLAQEKELKEIAEQKRLRELELEQELTNIKQILQQKVEQTEQQKLETEQQLNMRMEQLQKLSNEEKNKVEQLQKEREEIQNQLLEAQKNAEASLTELRQREKELATLADARIQAQADQSNEVITLQEQLEKMKNTLKSLETEKNSLLNVHSQGATASSSKQSALTKVGELMDSELQCIICSEMFIEATVLNCAHTFCRYCITMWKKKKKDCPICRASITSENRSLVVDNFIERMVNENLTEEMKVKRQDILKFRAEQVSISMTPKPVERRSTSTRTRAPQMRGRGRGRGWGRGMTSSVEVGPGSSSPPIPTVDLTMIPIPMSPAERPPVLPPPLNQLRDQLTYQLYSQLRQVDSRILRQLRGPPSSSTIYHSPEGIVLTDSEDEERIFPVFPDHITEVMDAATRAGRGATGPPAAPSDNAAPPTNPADNN